MNFEQINWHDSDIKKIEIEYDCAKLFIYNEAFQKDVCVICAGFIGLTDLCIWDDQIIDCAEVIRVTDDYENEFIRRLFSAYDKGMNYGERRLSNGILEVKIRLVNNITFSLYCQSIEVVA